MTKKTLALAASMMIVVGISGQAFAGTAESNARLEATGLSGRQAAHAFNAMGPATVTSTVEPNAHRYHGGPKSND
jgi:hypothetical protein